MKQLSVRLLGKPIGILSQTDSGTIEYQYEKQAQKPLSISLPIQSDVFSSRLCRPYFEGLLPESDVVRTLIGKKYGISPHNIFSLLESIGHDCAGAVSFHQLDEAVSLENSHVMDGRELNREELKQLISDLPKRPLFTDVDGLRLSLAGIQDKAALCYKNGNFMIPHGLCPTTHIVKTPIPDIEGSILNEYSCLKIAKNIGLLAPDVEIFNFDGVEFLLIERYDRHELDGKIIRLHQEDFCQALGILPGSKYENEGGPSTVKCFNLVENSYFSGKDKLNFLKYFVFNILIGNKDAHGKNYSFLYNLDQNPSLSPLYDVLCTDMYPSLTKKMAMKIGGKYLLGDVYDRHWKIFSEDLGISLLQLTKLIFKTGEQIKNQLNNPDFTIEKLHEDIWQNFKDHILKNIDMILSRLK